MDQCTKDAPKQQRERLPLAELLVQSHNSNIPCAPVASLAMAARPQMAPPPPPTYTAPLRTMPTPTKSVTELAYMASSPMPSTPMWGQYGTHSMLSPVAGGDPSPMWPRDPIDVLMVNTPDSVAYSRYVGRNAQHPFGGPLVPPPMVPPPTWYAPGAGYPSSGYLGAASEPHAPRPFVSATPTTPPSLGRPGVLDFGADHGDLDTSGNDDVVAVDLNERLASLDAVCKELSADVVNLQTKSVRHRI